MSLIITESIVNPYAEYENLLTGFPSDQKIEAVKWAEDYHKTGGGSRDPWYSGVVIYSIDYPGGKPREILRLNVQLKFNFGG